MFAEPKETLPGTPEHDTIQDEQIRHLQLEIEGLRETITELAWAITWHTGNKVKFLKKEN